MNQKVVQKIKPLIEIRQERIKSRPPFVFKNQFIGNKLEEVNEYDITAAQNFSSKSLVKLDRALNSNKFFKRKSTHHKNPYGPRSDVLSKRPYSGLRNSSDFATYKNCSKRSHILPTRGSTRETRGISDLKSSYNVANISSDYSFYDRGFKEYELSSSRRKKKIRPMTADERRNNSNIHPH